MKSSFFVITIALSICIGCGPAGPKRYEIKGEVRYNGELVPGGSIVFTPDSGAGTIGPQAITTIHEGRYSFDAANGVVAGNIIVDVNGTHDFQEGDSGILGKSLFDDHQERFEMPAGAFEKNFDISGPKIKIIR